MVNRIGMHLCLSFTEKEDNLEYEIKQNTMKKNVKIIDADNSCKLLQIFGILLISFSFVNFAHFKFSNSMIFFCYAFPTNIIIKLSSLEFPFY